MFDIENPNSSGQGFAPSHREHPLHAEITHWGYTYSHSVPVTSLSGDKRLYHCYTHGDHNIGVYADTPLIWSTSTSCGSGRQWTGKGFAELTAHLRSKARRYGLRKSDK